MAPDRELQFLNAWRLWGLDAELVRGCRFHASRRWKFDFAEPDTRVAVEIEGIVFWGQRRSRHQTARGYEGDCEKYNAAVELGWVVLRYSQGQVTRDPRGCVDQVARVITARRGSDGGAALHANA